MEDPCPKLFTLRADTGEYNKVATELYVKTYVAKMALGGDTHMAFSCARAAVNQLAQVTQFSANLGR
jgi:hypothetical protein